MSYKKKFSFEVRNKEAINIIKKYPDRIPIIVEKSDKCCGDIDNIDKKKYLVPNDLTIGQFQYVIRKRIKLQPEKALFIFINNLIPPTSQKLLSAYDEYKDKDGFLYVCYSGENTFG